VSQQPDAQMQKHQLQREIGKDRKQQTKLKVTLTDIPMIENILITLPE